MLSPLKNGISPGGNRPKKLKLHLCQFPILLSEHFKVNVKEFLGLYPHQRVALPKVLKGIPILKVVDTNKGKTEVACGTLHRGAAKGKIGIYLVPYKRRLEQKYEMLAEFLNRPLREANREPQE